MKETGKVFGVLQRVGRAFMLPIAVLQLQVFCLELDDL